MPRAADTVLADVLEDTALPMSVRGTLHMQVGVFLFNQGEQVARARAEMTRALPWLGEGSMTLAWCYLSLALPFDMDTGRDENLRWLEEAIAMADRTDDPDTRSVVQTQRPAVLLCLGDPSWRRAVDELPPAVSTKTQRRNLAVA